MSCACVRVFVSIVRVCVFVCVCILVCVSIVYVCMLSCVCVFMSIVYLCVLSCVRVCVVLVPVLSGHVHARPAQNYYRPARQKDTPLPGDIALTFRMATGKSN